jgi:TonB family protein
MRQTRLFLIVMFFVWPTIPLAVAQNNQAPNNQAPNQKTVTQQASTPSEQPKNAVDRAIEEAKKRGETVLGACLQDCGADSESPVLKGKAIELPIPSYPMLAHSAHASGVVEVQILIDTDGNVIAAAAISGHPLLLSACVSAARNARFTPTLYEGKSVNVTGVIR